MQLRPLSLLALVLLTCCQGYPRGAALCTRVPRYAKLAPSSLLVHNACVDVSAVPGFAAGAQLAQVVADAGMKVAAAARCEWQLVLTLAPPTELDDEAGAVWANGADSLERYAVQSAVVAAQDQDRGDAEPGNKPLCAAPG